LRVSFGFGFGFVNGPDQGEGVFGKVLKFVVKNPLATVEGLGEVDELTPSDPKPPVRPG